MYKAAELETTPQKNPPKRVFCGLRVSVLTCSHFYQVVAELSLNRALYNANRGAEHNLIELGHHLATAKGSQLAAQYGPMGS